jgi:hypothetical protein
MMLALWMRRVEFSRALWAIKAFLERHHAFLGDQKSPTVKVMNIQIDAVSRSAFMSPIRHGSRIDAYNPGRCGKVIVALAIFKLEGSIFVPSAESIRVFGVSFHWDTLPEFARKSISKIHSERGAFMSQPALIGMEPLPIATANGAAHLKATSSGVSAGPDLESAWQENPVFAPGPGIFSDAWAARHNLDIWLTGPHGTYHWRNQCDGYFE